MEFVKVVFPTLRAVNVDGAPQGKTGKIIRLQAGTHHFDMGEPLDYKPSSQAVLVTGTSKTDPLEVIFEPRLAIAARTRRTRKRVVGTRKAANKGARKAPDAVRTAGPQLSEITLRGPSRTFALDAKDPDGARSELQRAAMRWSYILRNRERWKGLPISTGNQADRSRDLLGRLGISAADLDAVANDSIVEVGVPYRTETEGWEGRVFPWEFIIAAATREARHGRPLTVLRHLDTGPVPAPRRPVKVLYVESAPGRLASLYSFETERAVVKTNLRATERNWEVLETPTLKRLTSMVKSFRPDIIHLAGFDTHQGLRLLQPLNDPKNAGRSDPPRTEQEQEARPTRDGYLMAGKGGEHEAVDAETLAAALCIDGHRPMLVSFSIQNSAARVAALTVAAGAHAAIGFQDAFDDRLVELFFGSFYRSWRKKNWDLVEGFRAAWETVRSHAGSLVGSGLVLWSARSLVKARTRHAPDVLKTVPVKRPLLLPGGVNAEHAMQVIKPRIQPVSELNYSILHNRCALFEHFTLMNGSADLPGRNDDLATVGDVDVKVTLCVGAGEATYEQRLSLDTTSRDLRDDIHVPLTSELMRTVHESMNSSLMVEVSWGKAIYRESHRVRLLPVDQWRDNDKDGMWLPSFVLPRDPSVTGLIDKAQRYVRVIRDDPSAGFDGYQSLDPQAAEPAAEVDRQVQAIWSTIVHELQLGYINPPPTYSNAMDSQRLRTPSMIIKDHSGTCLDLALMFAACCELVDVYPVIFLLKDHAFPGYWRDERFHQEFIELSEESLDEIDTNDAGKTAAPGAQRVAWWFRDTAFKEIARQVTLGRLVPLESVWLTEHSGFWEAVEGGRELMKKSRFHSMLDIARAREAGVTPLPFGGRP